MTPQRVQLRRKKGWRMPPNTVNVARPSTWGNPYRVGLVSCGCRSAGECMHNVFRTQSATEAVQAYAAMPRNERRLAAIRNLLGGKNLACWCALNQPCHADVLLRLANAGAA